MMFEDLQEYSIKEVNKIIVDESWKYKVHPIIMHVNDNIHITYHTDRTTNESISFKVIFETLTFVHVLNNISTYEFNTHRCKSMDQLIFDFKKILKTYLEFKEKPLLF